LNIVYLLKSVLGYTYIGQTKNLEDRLKRHYSNRNISTKYKGNWQLVLKKEFLFRTDAIIAENKLIRMKNFDKAREYLTSLV
jgi:putative endonuclease